MELFKFLFLDIFFILSFRASITYYKNESIYLNSWHHSHKKQKDSPETQVTFVDILAWSWNILGGRTENTSKQQKMVVFDFEAVLASFCCYYCGANASEVVHKISTGTLELHVITANFTAELHLWKNIFSSLLPYCWDTSQVSIFFSDINKNE